MGQAGRTRRRSAQRWADDRGARRAQPAAAREPGAARRARDTIKSRGLVRDGDRFGAVTAFEFVSANQASYRTATMCRVLEVPTSGYYAGCKRSPSARAQADAELTSRMNAIHERSHEPTARRAFMPNSRPR